MQKPGSIEIGSNVSINTRRDSNLAGICQKTILQTVENGEISIGNYSGISGTILSSRAMIRLGNRVSIGVNTRIYDHDFHSLEPEHRKERLVDKAHVQSLPVSLEDDVFIGANVIILKGVHIGARSVVAAGAVVVRGDYPEDSLIAGNPARVVKTFAK